MSIDDIGAKRLIAAVLKNAYDDYQKEVCPEYCPIILTCDNRKFNRQQCDAKQFIHSAWAASLCDGIGIEHETHTNAVIKKIEHDTFKHIETELRNYKASLLELEHLKHDLICAVPVMDNPEGTSYTVGNPTESKAFKILHDRKIKHLQDVTSAIKEVYLQCDKPKQELIEMRYWQNRYKDSGIADILGISSKTFYRWRRSIVLSIAIKLGYI